MAGADIAAEVGSGRFGALVTIGILWFSYSRWKYDRPSPLVLVAGLACPSRPRRPGPCP
jgi:hypothetical protein